MEGESGASALCFTADGSRLFVTRHPGAVDAWTLARGVHAQLLAPISGTVGTAIVIHPNGVVRTSLERSPFVVSLADPKGTTINGVVDVRQVIVSPGSNWVIVVTYLDGAFRLAGYPCKPDLHFGGDSAWEVLPRVSYETLLGFVGDDRFVTIDDQLLVIRDAATGAVRTTVKYPSHHLHSWAVSPDGSRFAVMGYDQLYLWDIATWGTPARVSGLNRPIVAMAFHPTHPTLATVQRGQTLVKFLDADTGKSISKFQWKLGKMCSVAFSPDGTLAAAGSASGKIVVWDIDE